MKTIIYCSSYHHKNTFKIAQILSRELKAEIIDPADFDFQTDLNQYDLIGFGSGVYMGKFHRNLYKLVNNLTEVKNKSCFIFSTSGIKSLPIINYFYPPFKKLLENKGFRVISYFSCPGWDTYGPYGLLKYIGGIKKGRPNQHDLNKANQFGQKLIYDLRYKN
jgi:flavodoxin